MLLLALTRVIPDVTELTMLPPGGLAEELLVIPKTSEVVTVEPE